MSRGVVPVRGKQKVEKPKLYPKPYKKVFEDGPSNPRRRKYKRNKTLLYEPVEDPRKSFEKRRVNADVLPKFKKRTRTTGI